MHNLQPKQGNNIVTFSLNKHHPEHWQSTKAPREVLEMWNKAAPPPGESEFPDPHKRKQSVVWNRKLDALVIELRHSTTMTNRDIAVAINQHRGTLFDSRSRAYSKRDVQRRMKKLFPSELDVVQTMFALKEMRNQKGWESLRYVPDWTQTKQGVTLRSLTVEMPHAKELVKRFGNVIHVDATFNTLIYGHKVCVRTRLNLVSDCTPYFSK